MPEFRMPEFRIQKKLLIVYSSPPAALVTPLATYCGNLRNAVAPLVPHPLISLFLINHSRQRRGSAGVVFHRHSTG